MSITFKCHVCGAINQITCPDCDAPYRELVGPLDLYLPALNVSISIDIDETGRYLRVKKPTGEQTIPLQEESKSNDNPL